MADTVLPELLPVRKSCRQIHCYQSESVIVRYSVTRSVTSLSDIDRYSVSSQRVLLAETVLPGVLPAKEYY